MATKQQVKNTLKRAVDLMEGYEDGLRIAVARHSVNNDDVKRSKARKGVSEFVKIREEAMRVLFDAYAEPGKKCPEFLPNTERVIRRFREAVVKYRSVAW